MSLKKTVKKNLNEVKSNKITRLTESKIVKGRFRVFSESVNLNSKIQTTKFFNKLFTESNNLVSMGISKSVINEDLIMVLRGLMGDENSQVIDILRNRLISYLESKLQMDTFEKDVLTQTILELDEEEFPNIFSDKRFLPRKITDTFIREFSEKYLEGLTDMTRDILINRIDNEDFKRDKSTCQYCGSKKHLTIDHVMPRSRGGGNTWKNLVACCSRCNVYKGNKTPREAGMKLMNKPYEPSVFSSVFYEDAEDIWNDFKQSFR